MTLSRSYIARQQGLRLEILTRLYDRRSTSPQPGADFLWEKTLVQEIGGDPAETSFALSYLAEAGEIRVDGHHVRITAAGIDAVEAQPITHRGE